MDKEKKNVQKENTVASIVEPQIKQGPRIYCGPTYKGVQQYSIFNDGLPTEVESIVTNNVAFAALIVPLDELTTTKQRITTSGTFEQKSYISLGGN